MNTYAFEAGAPAGEVRVDFYAAREPTELVLANLSDDAPYATLADGQRIDAFLEQAGVRPAAHAHLVFEIVEAAAAQ